MFNSSRLEQGDLQMEKNRELLGFDLTLNHQQTIDEKIMESIGKI
jgi:hypothetical protein